MIKPPVRVVVEWVDARNVLEQDLTHDEALARGKLAHRTTVGYLVHRDDERTLLSADYDPEQPGQDEPNYGNLTVIPTGWVRSMHYLDKRRPRPTKPKGTNDGSASQANE
jgi:hypothetical protein